ncbi:MAG: metallophosphoesterase [Spirochaetales bacterium]|nr:metallophosphoesterase [Spirochaetales bacterium]
MKILCVADHIDPLVYSPNAKQRFRDVDFVLGAGDLPMDYLGFISATLNKPIYFVFGNHNLRKLQLFKNPGNNLTEGAEGAGYLKNFYGSTYIGGKCVKAKGKLLIVGLGGSILYNGGENQFTDREMYWKIFRLIPRLVWNKIVHGRYLDIFLAHSPPRQLGDREDDCHRGFISFRWFLKTFRPRYMLHGHVHLYNPNEERHIHFHQTHIVNVYDHYVLELEA